MEKVYINWFFFVKSKNLHLTEIGHCAQDHIVMFSKSKLFKKHLTSVAEPKLFIFGSGSDFDHNFVSGFSSSLILAL